MSPVVLYRSAKWMGSVMVDDWSVVFQNPNNLVLVESKDEEDFIWSMQMIYGGEVKIEQFDSGKQMSRYRMATYPAAVFCTWDPNDPNRI